jgi:hypothetical protein
VLASRFSPVTLHTSSRPVLTMDAGTGGAGDYAGSGGDSEGIGEVLGGGGDN